MWTKGKWEIFDANGKLPAIRKIAMPHGEASTHRAKIVVLKGNGLIQSQIAELDFGYGHKEDEANARRICHCVNNFDELVKAAEITINRLKGEPCRTAFKNIGQLGMHQVLYKELEQALAYSQNAEITEG